MTYDPFDRYKDFEPKKFPKNAKYKLFAHLKGPQTRNFILHSGMNLEGKLKKKDKWVDFEATGKEVHDYLVRERNKKNKQTDFKSFSSEIYCDSDKKNFLIFVSKRLIDKEGKEREKFIAYFKNKLISF